MSSRFRSRARLGADLFPSLTNSYDLDLDKRLSEETTVLVENYTVSRLLSPLTLTCADSRLSPF